MTQTVGGGVQELRAAMEGAVVTPEDAEYDQARLLWNANADLRPAVVARCSSTADVVAAVRYARAEELEIAVRCGAHSMSGQSGVDGGIVVDLSGMREVIVDPTRKRARAGGGALLSDLDAATQAHGLAVPSGMVGRTGIGGLTLGGGMGWLTRQAGWPSTTSSRSRSSSPTVESCLLRSRRTRICSGQCGVVAGTSGSSPSSSTDCTRSARWSSSRSCSGRWNAAPRR